MALVNVMRQADAIVGSLQAIDKASKAVAKTLNMVSEQGGEEGQQHQQQPADDGGSSCKDPSCKKSKSANFFKSNFKQIIGCFMAVALVLSSIFTGVATTAIGTFTSGGVQPNITFTAATDGTAP